MVLGDCFPIILTTEGDVRSDTESEARSFAESFVDSTRMGRALQTWVPWKGDAALVLTRDSPLQDLFYPSFLVQV
jgi:hypothetical protein